MAEGAIHPVAVLSGNRNFPGRVHPDLDLGFLMSPPLVIAFALAGDAQRDLRVEPVQRTASGTNVFLKDLWPSREEVDAVLATSQRPTDYRRTFEFATANPHWHAIEAPDSPLYPWNPSSTALRRPPFAALSEGSLLGRFSAWPLLIVGDDITTDHISPASAIPPDSLVADFLVERGDDRSDLNVFASRRGNWEVMVRAAFHSKTLKNLLAPQAPVAHTLHQPSGEIVPLWKAAERYRAAGESVVLLAGERYGTGSSRDWAAKGQRLLGIRAVLANSFERIHRSNLIGMGVLPVRLPPGVTPFTLRIEAGDRIELDAEPADIAPRCAVAVRIVRAGGRTDALTAIAAIETQLEVELLRAGGVIPSTLARMIAAGRADGTVTGLAN
jgi:aconitate hydratase